MSTIFGPDRSALQRFADAFDPERRKAMEQQKQLAAIGSVLSGQQTPQYLRPGMTTDSLTPDQFEQEKVRQLFALGSPEAAKVALNFVETPESRLNAENVKSQIAARNAQLGMQREELELTKAEKLRNYNLAAKELEAKLSTKGVDPKEIFDRETKLRNEFINQSKDFVTMRDAFAKIDAAGQNPSPAGDISLIYSFMKLNDPGSTVREGEFATAQNAGSVPDRVRTMYNKAITGERLDPKVRTDFIGRSKSLFDTADRQHSKRTQQYTDLATRSGGDPRQVIVDLQLVPNPPSVASPAAAPKVGGLGGLIKFLGFE